MVALVVVPETFPVTITVPVEIVISCLFVDPVPVNETLPAFKKPAPTASVLTLEPDFGIVTAPETSRVIPALMFKRVAVVVVKETDEQPALAVIVTL